MKSFFGSFMKNSGFWVGTAMFLSRFSGFLVTALTARMLTSEDFGLALYALNFLGFFIPLCGMGSYQGALRFGSIASTKQEKYDVINHSFYYGMIGQFVVNFFMIAISFIFIKDISVIQLVFIFSVRFLGVYLVEQAKVNFRALGENKKFALTEIYFAISNIILCSLCTYFFGVKGYIFSLCISPYFILFYHKFRLIKVQIPVDFKEFWKFCWISAFTLQVWQWVFYLDIYFVGYFFSTTDVTHYKLSAMIPFNLLFISQVVLQTEYPNLCKNHLNKQYFSNFLKNYYLLFLPINALIILLSYTFTSEIMSVFAQQDQSPDVFLTLIWVSVISSLFRTPFGNLLSSIGKAKVNFIVAIISLVILTVFCFVFHQKFGLKGIAYASLLGFICSGLLAMFLFFIHFSRQKKLIDTETVAV